MIAAKMIFVDDCGNAADGVSIIHYSLKSCLQAASAFSLGIYPLAGCRAKRLSPTPRDKSPG